MATAKKCDLCGDLYEPYNEKHNESKPNGFMYLNIDKRENYYSNKVIDCCPACMNYIKDCIKSIPKKGEE